MQTLTGRLLLLTVSAFAVGCEQKQDVAMNGNADSVTINYVGELSDTLPIARRHCAQYEKIPVLRASKDNYATYACVKPGTVPGTSS
jgi:hypothetical protein